MQLEMRTEKVTGTIRMLAWLPDWLVGSPTDQGRPMKPFFIEIQNFWAWAENWADKFWSIWGIFGQLSAPFWYSKSLVHVFHYSTIISTKQDSKELSPRSLDKMLQKLQVNSENVQSTH